MAADIWTINLTCDGADPGQEYVQREMDKDEICFFNLIDMIKEYGYTSTDNLYYKSKDGMVVIEFDSNVMEMLEEYESEKEVTLFVTWQKIAFMVPTKSRSASSKTKGKIGKEKKKRLHVVQTEAKYANEDDQHDGGPEDTQGDDDDEVKKRGGTVLTHVWDLLEGKRILVKCNKLGQRIGKEGGLLGQFLGTIARNGGYCPVDIKDWRNVKKDSAETMLQLIQTKFLYHRSCEKWILKSIGRDWRKYKATLKKKLFNPKKKRSTLYNRCPDDVEKDQWIELVRYWKSAEGVSLSEKNKLSQGMKKPTHTAGTKSYACWSEDLRQADPAKKQPHRAKVYLATHRKRVKGTNQHVDLLENLIDNHPELAENSEGRTAWQGDALHQVLGEEKAGHVHGMGLLPVPNQVYGRMTHHFRDMNMVTIHGSSSDVETHMLEEIRQLKEHSRQQDKVIEELKNQHIHHQNTEATMENCETSHPDNSEDQVVQSKRKEGEPSSQLCTIGSQNKEFGECVRSSRGGRTTTKNEKMSNSQQGVLQETTTQTQKEVVRAKVSCHKSSKHKKPTPIKVGSTVLLKTAKYPNKATVAYATLLSTSPKANVGGVEIGNQFYKVRINHPIEEEPLVRPMTGYNTIGDAHAKGSPIAWPSVCVEIING